jgi:hypothetical protein
MPAQGFLEYVKKQRIPCELLEVLHEARVQFFEGASCGRACVCKPGTGAAHLLTC